MERYFNRKFPSTTSNSDNVGSSSSKDVVGNLKEGEFQDVLANLPYLGLQLRNKLRQSYNYKRVHVNLKITHFLKIIFQGKFLYPSLPSISLISKPIFRKIVQFEVELVGGWRRGKHA